QLLSERDPASRNDGGRRWAALLRITYDKPHIRPDLLAQVRLPYSVAMEKGQSMGRSGQERNCVQQSGRGSVLGAPGRRRRCRNLHVEPKEQYVTIGHHVVLSFRAHESEISYS